MDGLKDEEMDNDEDCMNGWMDVSIQQSFLSWQITVLCLNLSRLLVFM